MNPTVSEVPVALLAGGLATRLLPLTAALPKSLLEVGGRPFIDHQLALLRRKGVRRVVVCLGHHGDPIERHLGSSAHCLELACSRDGERLLGTGGALKRALPLLGDLFWVMYGDTYADVDLHGVLARFSGSAALGVMTVLRNEGRWDASNVVFEAGRLVRYDKAARSPEMAHIDYGVTLLRRAALDAILDGEPCDLADLYRALVEQGRLAGHEVSRRFHEIGSPAALRETNAFLREEARTMSYTQAYLEDTKLALDRIDSAAIDRLVVALRDLRDRRGRLFVLGVGGSAANASHAVGDFRKICGIEAYAPTDNVAELTARVNDDGWEGVFAEWLRVSRLGPDDMVLVFSVGGGDLERNISPNLVRALDYARERGAAIGGIVGRDGGHTARLADACVVVPTVRAEAVTPHAEALQAVVWHLLVSHPLLKAREMKWEGER
ncbi:MAG TPA: sugar phosphate nucleotidyltransferase [Vicinamibacteria bacterium]|nr:sugar phosphate nucleotidyltransferase [Vicinamibacteria bacterium]